MDRALTQSVEQMKALVRGSVRTYIDGRSLQTQITRSQLRGRGSLLFTSIDVVEDFALLLLDLLDQTATVSELRSLYGMPLARASAPAWARAARGVGVTDDGGAVGSLEGQHGDDSIHPTYPDQRATPAGAARLPPPRAGRPGAGEGAEPDRPD